MNEVGGVIGVLLLLVLLNNLPKMDFLFGGEFVLLLAVDNVFIVVPLEDVVDDVNFIIHVYVCISIYPNIYINMIC